MKKAKIMLTSIAVLAVVGGALAFKATKFGQGNVFCKFAQSPNCRLTDYTTDFYAGQATTTNPCTASGQTVYYTENACITSFIETLNTVTATGQ
jgi:uncharacterized protein YxeA